MTEWICIGEGNGNPLQYSCLENPSDRGTWWATVHGVTESGMTEVIACDGSKAVGLPFKV